MYQEMVECFEQDPEIDFAVCGYNYIKENGEIDRAYHIKENELLSREKVYYMLSDLPPTIRHVAWNKLFRKSMVQGIRFDENVHSSEDVLFLTEYVEKIKKAVFVHKPLYMNLIRLGSATHGGLNSEKLAKAFPIHEKMYRSTVSAYPMLKNHALAFLLDVCTLKYKEIRKGDSTHLRKKTRKFIRKYGVKALLNKEIYWKTRIAYVLLK
jgi:hypothetical protein